MWGCFKVAKEVDEEVVWVGCACVSILGRFWFMDLGVGPFVMLLRDVTV
jgi:hypothetical protein